MENVQNYRKICSNLRADGKCMLQSDLTSIPTADLVRELTGREGVECSTLLYEVYYDLTVYDGDNDEGMSGYGPATILVIPGDLNE